MAERSAHDLAKSYDCKTPDCTGVATSRVGRYSYCDFCRKQRAKASTPPALKSQPSQGSFEQRARQASKRLIAAGRDLDRSKSQASTAVARVRAAQGEWDAVVGELAGQRAA